MPKVEHKLAEVYGVARGVPLTYVPRSYVDDKFIGSLTRDKHVVVYGGSKQGKTSLRKQCLRDDDYVVVQCGNTTSRAQIYETLLKLAGASISVTQSEAVSGAKKVDVSFGAKGGIKLVAEVGGDVKGGYEKTDEKEVTTTSFEIDPSDPNDVIRVLDSVRFKKFIVLEDFHYLADEVQREVAFDLKAFHEKSALVFIVVGVWLESNKLVLFNGDLSGRLVPVDADKWEPQDLANVITGGEPLLNISFPEEVKAAILAGSQENVGVVQETCYRLCEATGVTQTQKEHKTVGTTAQVTAFIKAIGQEQAGRYQKFLEDFSEGLSKTELEMYKWIAYALVTTKPADLKKGLKLTSILRRLNDVHPSRRGQLQANNVAQALQNVGKVQHKYHVKPTILDFDQSENMLRVTDSGFILYIAGQDPKTLLDQIGIDALAQAQAANDEGE